ncbi:uncharacterized protein PAF06_004553 [Gastrophryne carolinensis]
MDELLHWLEIRITTSLRPRAEEIKALLLDHTYRSYLCEFLKNEDVHTLYIYFKLVKASLAASLSPPSSLQDKCICFLKLGSAVKLTAENIADHVMSVDCDRLPVKYFDSLFHQVYLPLLSHNNTIDGAQYTDKIIDILHKVTGNLEVIAGHTEGSIVLPIPSLELLRSTSQFNKQGAAIHIMETVVIGWIRQIKAVLKHEPLEEIKNKGAMAGIYQEKEMWDLHIHNLESISLQLTSAETREIVFHLEQAKNLYGNSISAVTKDVKTACHQAKENLTFLKTLINCFDQLQSAATLSEKQRYFFQMLHRLLFVWRHSRYYHQRKVFANLLRLMSNEVVNIASALLGNDGLDNPQLYTLLKEALKLCATFRGNYLDVKIKADEYNARKIEETHNLNKAKNGRETVCRVTMYEVPASRVFGRNPSLDDKKQKIEEDDIWVDSPWPLYSAPCFQNMNMFMERCNDVLDLVETMRHFEVLKSVSLIGGAGTSSLDTMVQDIWSAYCMAKDTFMNQVKLIFNTDKNNPFQKAFFELRTKIKNLEHQLGNILRISFDGCPTVASQLRLLEVFEGVSRRDIVKEHLKDKDIQLYSMFMEEIQQVKDMFLKMSNNPPLHVNMTPLVSKFLWIKGLQARISDPMSDLRKVSPITLEGDMGWELRHLYTVTSEELQRFENNLMTSWLSDVNREVVDCLKLPLLKTSDPVHDFGEFLCTVEINLNPDLMVYLREAQFFSKPPFTMKLPEAVATLVSSMDINRLKILSTRLETVVSKYNEVIKSISIHQRALFEKKLLKISEILTDGMSLFSWSMDESNDYAELASTYICTDLYHNFAIVTNNYKLINELTALWCTGNLDIFTCREPSRSYSITELMLNQKKIEHDLEGLFLADGHRIHSLVQQCFVACGIGEASPVWQEFLKHVDTIVLQGLKKVTVSSLAALLNTLLDRDHNGILTIEVELINGEVAFNPPLDQSTSDTSVMESIEDWLKMFLLRGSHIQGFSSNVKCGYHEYISEDEEALHLIGLILQQVESCVLECQTLLDVFKSYSFLWKNDVDVEFQNFLHGEQKNETENEAAQFLLSDTSVEPQNQSLLMAEGAFILPKNTGIQETRGPLLKDFDSEISIYKAARDSIQKLPDHQQCQWLQADFRPIKQVLCAYALKWMWSLTKFLIDQTSATLKNLDSFLRRTEPQIESITGEERDTGSFMKMMRLFNEVSSKQAEMEVQFTVLQKTVSLLEKHEMPLPAECEILYKTMPARWNAMKTKVSLAKQRLGPRIQQEADVVSRDLEQFQHKLDKLGSDIENSEVYKFECTAEKAFVIIQNFNKQLQIFEREAKDLKELQDLLETTVVDFSILTNCKELLQNLSLVWQNVDSILQEHNVWKTKFWQEMNIKELQQKSGLQLTLLETLPAEVQEWDVYKQALEATNVVHLTLPLIEDLSNPAMRTRHWKQLVRQTGGMLRVTAESLKTMTLGDLLAMDLQKHTGDVKTTVQRAVRDVTTENSLKNCEEVWLSRIFDLSPHSRIITARVQNEELASSVSGSHYTKGDLSRNLTTGKGSRRLSRQSDRGLHLSKKTGRGSTVSLYESLQHIEDFGKICLLRNTDSVFEELEHHQLVLTSIQPYAEAGSFLDEVTKWQKKLQVIETTVQLWLSVQDKWTQLEEVFSTLAFRVAMPREAMLFADVHHHFCRLMKSVEENPNILQNCIRRGLQSLLDMLNYKLERCQRAVRLHLEHKRQLFPRLFFLSLEDSVNIMCYGYDLKVLSGYIVKMFHHVHSLIYQVNSENECNQILGVRSFCGEEFYLIQPLECSVPVENWLPRLVNSIKASLQHYLWAAVEDTNTVITRRREIHSAGARRVLVNKTVTKREAVTDEKQMSAFQEKSESVSIASESHLSRHWVLDTPSDVAYLSTHVKFSQAHQHGSQLSNEAMQIAAQSWEQEVFLGIGALNCGWRLMVEGFSGYYPVSDTSPTHGIPDKRNQRYGLQNYMKWEGADEAPFNGEKLVHHHHIGMLLFTHSYQIRMSHQMENPGCTSLTNFDQGRQSFGRCDLFLIVNDWCLNMTELYQDKWDAMIQGLTSSRLTNKSQIEQHESTNAIFNALHASLIKKSKVWWDTQFLQEYIDKRVAPRGLRLRVFPQIGYITEDFKQKWEGALQECSLTLMTLLIDQHNKHLKILDEQITKLVEDLGSYKKDDYFTKRDNSIKISIEKLNKELIELKEHKLQRDSLTYKQSKAYVWPGTDNRPNRRDFPPRYFSSSDSSSSRERSVRRLREGHKPSWGIGPNYEKGHSRGDQGPNRGEVMTRSKTDTFEVIKDLHLFARKILCKHLFEKKDLELEQSFPSQLSESELETDLLALADEATGLSPMIFPKDTPLRKPSNFYPPLNTNASVQTFVNVVTEAVENLTHKPNSNLSKSHQQALRELEKLEGLTIKPADKGGNIVIMDNSSYEQMCLKILENRDWYERAPMSRLSQASGEYHSLVEDAIAHRVVDGPTGDYLGAPCPRIATFYALPKVHKSMSAPPGRPIVSGMGSLTDRASRFIDHHLQPLVYQLPSYLKDTGHLLRILDGLTVPPGTFLVGLDVEALYSSIPHQQGLAAIRFFLNELDISRHNLNIFILRLLEFVLTHNFFLFNGSLYHQVQGTAMGTTCAPSYIDDIFILWSGPGHLLEDFIRILNCNSLNLKFTHEVSTCRINFLDLTVTIDSLGQINSCFYRKASAANTILRASSAHPQHLLRSIPYGEYLRARRNCTQDKDFKAAADEIRDRLLLRGYNKKVLSKAYTKAIQRPRSEILYKPKLKEKERPLAISLTYTVHHNQIRNIFRRHWHILANDDSLKNIIPDQPALIFRRAKSLRDKLVSSHYASKKSEKCCKTSGTYQCQKRCSCCKFMQTVFYVSPNVLEQQDDLKATIVGAGCHTPEIQPAVRHAKGCLKDLTEGIEYAAKILNEIPQKDSQLYSERNSKAERKGNGRDQSEDLGNDQDITNVTPNPTLSASDVVKLTNHILLLLYQRDVTIQILSGTAPIWMQNQPLCYQFDDNTKEVVVKIGNCEVFYGFEYQGSAKHTLLTPFTERILLSVMGAVSAGTDALCDGPLASGKRSTIQELSLILGKPLFCFNCTNKLNNGILQDICKGLAAAEAWVCLNGLEQLSQPNLSLLAQMLTQIHSAKRLRKETVTLELEEVPLNTSGMCFALIKRLPNDTQSYKLPGTLLNCFRIVGISKVPVGYILEAQLLLKGFSCITYLAQKLSSVVDSFAKLHTANYIESGTYQNEKLIGFSFEEIGHLLNRAGEILRVLKSRNIENQEQVENADEDWQQKLEDKAIVTAIYDCWLLQFSNARAQAFKTLLEAEWPHAVYMALFSITGIIFGFGIPDVNQYGLLPAVIAAKYGPGQQVSSSECTEESSVPSAIIKAAEKCHILPSNTFTSKVSHLVQLASTYQTVVITGPAGCGKTSCIKTFVETLKGKGKNISIDTVYTEALQSGNFLGFTKKNTGWIDGLLPKCLRKCCKSNTITDHSQMNILHLDGEVNGHEIEIMQSLFCGADFLILENKERIQLSKSFLLLWELDTLANVAPSILAHMGILAMASSDIDYRLPLNMWMSTQAEEHQPLLCQLIKTFLEPSLQFLRNKRIIHQPGMGENLQPRDLFLYETNVVQTFCRIAKALMLQVPDMLDEDIHTFFIFSCLWSFGGWLDSAERTMFSNWWRHTFRHHATFPAEGEVWDYHIDTDTRHFVRWHDTLSSFSVSHGQGMASEVFVHTQDSEQLLYLSSLLTTSGCPVLLAGDPGCGKSVLSHELLNALCLGDVAEMSELNIPINSSTDSLRLWECLKDRLEWRHGTLHTPAGNKKLLCLLDDLNLAKTNEHGVQPACEFVRQLIDQQNIYDPLSGNWKTISGVVYLATWNTRVFEHSPGQRQRLLRHFCTFHCKYPSQTEQFGIFSSILNAYFISGVTENKATCAGSMSSECIQDLIGAVTKVSIELQERLRTVFLGTPQRCHYIFTLRDLAKIFRNLCLSLDGGTSAEKLLRLWRHECDWVYGHRMSSSVDYNRYVQELSIAAEKQFMNEEEVQIIVGSQQPLFSNIVEDDGGLISTLARQQDVNFLRRSEKAATSIHILDGYQETFDSVHVKQLLTEALREYNKVNPRMSITFYQCSINLLCRLARNLGSPHGSAHTLLCGEGCPRYSSTIARLAAHISGFTVVQCGSQTKTEDDDQRDRNFKSQIVDCYVKAGLKGQRTLLLLTEEDIDPTALVYITEFVVSGSVSHLFTLEQQATIANAMRSEVINAGLTYSKENAWNLFLQAVKQNIRWLLIHSDMGATFYKWCIQFPSLVNALNVCYIPQWSREMLVEHAGYHLQELSMVTNQEKENVCYLLSSMHLSIIRYAHGSYSKITNATFENFAQCFGALMKEEYCMIMKDHDIAKEALVSIQQRLNSHEKLTDDLTHEKTVLEQHKEGTLKILQQIAQDKAVVEQKIHVVYKQLQKIKRLSVLLPQYQVALEKAEYKCSAILENIKDIVHSMDISALAELRSMQKPDVDIEELMASIIIILKSPNTDLTWAKGAKRQMANLDRFLNELISFHVIQLPQSTLELLEANIRKSQFTSENMEKKAAGNVAAASLMKWLQSAVQYFGTLTSKVKPLQSRVSEMTTSLIDAEQKMTILQQKKKTFLSRLSDLERGFEEATMHKNKQQQRTIEMNHKLLQSTQVAQLLEEENKKYASIVSSLQDRLSGIPGSTALAAGLVSYLGSYEHHYRQLMLTVEWPMAVKERGFPLMIDSIDPLKGRIIEFSMIFPQSAPSEIHDAKTLQTEGKNNNTENEEVHYEGDELSNEQSLRGQSLPVITQDIYIDFIRALILRLVKRDKIEKWLSQDWTPQQMENAAILAFSWQRPVLLIEPCFEGESWIKRILGKTENNQFSSVNLQTRQDRSVLAPIEKGILSGGPLILNNYSSKWDDLLMPLIDHCCAVNNINNQQDTSSIISFNGHRLLCPDYFKLYLAADELEPNLKPEISSGMTIINYSYSGECLLELLLRRAFEKLQPDLHKMLTETTNIILGHQQSLTQLENKSYTSFIQSNVDGDIDIISVSEEKKKISIEIEKSKLKLAEILQLRDMLYPIAQQGALLYSILKSLQSLAKEYDFTFDFFLNLFDKAIATQDRTKEDVFQINTFHEDSYLASPPLEDEEPEPQMDKAALTLKHKQDIGDAAPLPASPSEQHTFTLSPSQMQKIMDKSIQAVYQLLIQTLLPEHSTQACALLFLCVQHMEHANAITEEEVAFFLKGSSVFTDVNFNTNLNSPSWLPHERWEDVKALSNNSVQLSSLCDQIIQNDSEWERWYKSDYQDGENTVGGWVSSSSGEESEAVHVLENAPNHVTDQIEELIEAILEILHLSTPWLRRKKKGEPYKHLKVKQGFPRLSHFNRLVEKEWEKLDRLPALPKFLDAKYPFPEEAVKVWSSQLEVDLIPTSDNAALRDPVDRSYVQVQEFCMESLRSVVTSLEPGDFLIMEDIKDVQIFPGHQQYLHFAVGTRHFQLVALPFGLSTALREDLGGGEGRDADANGSSRSSIFQLPSVSAEGSYLHDFHALLIIRAARPDCFPNAVCQWVKQLSRGLDFQSPNQSIENLAENVCFMEVVYYLHYVAIGNLLDQSTCGILVIEPSNTVNIPFYSGAILSHGAKPTIIRAAKELDIPLFVVSVKNDNEKEVKMALNETMKQIGWLVIENLHLASEAMLKNLFKSLQYASKMRASQKEERQMCVWLTSELGTSIPKDFLACLKKVSWHFLINQGRKKSLDDYIYVESPSRLLLSAITSALAQTNEEAFSRLKMAPPTIQRLYFGICVLHGLLQTQQIIPKTGLNHLADMSYVQMHQALHVVLSTYDKVKTCENNFYVAVVEEVNLIYSGLSQTSEDADYIEALVHEIISSTLNQEEFLVINKLKIPVPPEFVNPEGYSGWLADYMGAKQFKKEALLMYTDENDVVNTYASLFMLSLSAMYDSMQSSLALITDKHRDPVKQLAYLRRNIELVLEHLPPLIETDGINMLFKENISNDKWTSEESQNNYSNYVLLQECNWMNTNLTQIKDGISALSRCLLGGLRAIPENLKDIAEALHNGEVPRSWLPLHSCQTSHSISTWLEGLLMKYKQLKQWVRKGLFPFANSEKEALTCISLTGLVNPEALLLALRTEFAVHHGFLLHEVVLQCHITDYLDNQLEINMHSLYLKDLVLKGAAWDSQKQCLVESRDMVNPLPYVAIIPTLRNVKQTVDNTEFYQCPVYSDYTMQYRIKEGSRNQGGIKQGDHPVIGTVDYAGNFAVVAQALENAVAHCCMMKLPLLATKPLSQWHLQKVSLFLNPDTAFTTPVEEPHPTKNRNRALLNSLTKMDTLSRSMVFNRPRRKLDSKTPAINNDDAITPLVSTSDEGLLNTANASIPRHFTSDTTDQITISGNNLASNQDVDIFHKGDVNDKHELDNAPYKNEDVNERGKDLAEGARFLEFHSDGAAVTVNEPSIREHLMEQIRETDYELSDNEQGPEDNNGSFDESVTEGYKEELDPKFQGNLAEGWQDNSDYAAVMNEPETTKLGSCRILQAQAFEPEHGVQQEVRVKVRCLAKS